MTIPLLATLAGAAFVSLVLTLFVMTASRRMRLKDSPGAAGHEKLELRDVPNTGGIAIYLTLAIPVLAGLALAWFGEGIVASMNEAWAANLESVRVITPGVLTLLGAITVLHVMGLVDDRRAVGAWPKLLVMVAVAVTMAVVPGDRLFTFLDQHAGGPWASMALTALWLVIVMNAVNFMDNMDGVAAGVVAVAAGCIFSTMLVGGEQWKVGLMFALLIGACLGFLVFNFPRASIFMGDSGSLVLGLMLGYLTINVTYFGGSADTPWYAVFMPLVVLAVPLYDFLSVVVIRLAQGKSPMVGDQQHFGHRLRAKGLSDTQVWLVLCGATAVTGVSGIVLTHAEGWIAALMPLQVGLVLTLVAVYEHGSRKAMKANGTNGSSPGRANAA
ncbi:MAG: MraY family glycosyltransferase [Phycisphaerales bacterium]